MKKLFLGFLLIFLASCAATPEIRLKSGDMSMEVKKQLPLLTSNIAYSPDGKSVLSGDFDGTVRLWNVTSGRLTKEFKGHTGHISSVAFSPDGKTIATGGNGTVKLRDIATGREIRAFTDYRGGGGLHMSYSPNNRYIMVPDFSVWGSASARLYEVQTGNVIREFQGFFQDFSPDNKYALFYSQNGINNHSDTSLYLVDVETGKELWSVKNALTDGAVFSPDNRHILVSRFLGWTGISTTYNFSFVLLDASTGRKLKEFGRGTMPTSFRFFISFSPDSRYVLIGGATGLTSIIYKLWDIEQGMDIKEILNLSSSLTCISSAFSRDGMSAVMNDGPSIRLYDIQSGEELATMIGFEDGEWIVTTPNGYYNASPKGDQYLSVKVGGKDYTIEQLRESFYRPDLVKLALSGGSLKEFRKLADIKEPPVVSIVNTPTSTDKDEITVTLKIVDSGGGVGDIRLYLNGSAVMLDSARGVKIVASNQNEVLKTYNLRLSNGLNSIRAIAFNGDNTMQSNDAIYQITASFKTFEKPSLNALIVGINDYKNPKLQLNYAVADAKLFAEKLKNGAAALFDKVNIKMLLTTEETTSENIIRELKAMRRLHPDDLFVFYVASHGTVDDGEYFLVTSNVGSTRTEKLKTDAIPQHTLKELIANIPATKKLIIIDTCSAGALGDAIQTAMLTRGMSEDTAMKVLSRAVGSTILSASTSIQEALEGYNGHGLFTYVLTEGLSGKADKGKSGYVKTTELADYVDNEVPLLAEKVFKKAQYPTISISGQAFPIGKTGK